MDSLSHRRFHYRHLFWALLIGLAGCAVQPGPGYRNIPAIPTITLPMFPGWYEGRQVYYVTTDVSDQDMARSMEVNYVPRLRDAVPPYPKPPGLKTVLERIYVFANFKQGSVLPSVPAPLGAESTDPHYSPLWLLYEVSWRPGTNPQVLKSEEEVLAAEAQGWVDIRRTDVVVNCPVVHDGQNKPLGIVENLAEDGTY